jgi:hypothetical protein
MRGSLFRRRNRVPVGFLIVGTHKGGTTSLWHYLGEHPRVVPSAVKEINFFSLHFERGVDWYRRQLGLGVPRDDGADVHGEASPFYLLHPDAPSRARAVAPEARIIVLLREPVARTWSHLQHARRMGHETLAVEDALAAEDERLAAERERMRRDPRYKPYRLAHLSYATRSEYADQVERWMAQFPREQVLILRSEDLYRDPAEVHLRTLRFLDLDPVPLERYENHLPGVYTNGPDPALAGRLARRFEEPNRRLADLVGDEVVTGWGVAGPGAVSRQAATSRTGSHPNAGRSGTCRDRRGRRRASGS